MPLVSPLSTDQNAELRRLRRSFLPSPLTRTPSYAGYVPHFSLLHWPERRATQATPLVSPFSTDQNAELRRLRPSFLPSPLTRTPSYAGYVRSVSPFSTGQNAELRRLPPPLCPRVNIVYSFQALLGTTSNMAAGGMMQMKQFLLSKSC